MKSIAKLSLQMTGLFEAEVFVRLMLWRWNHPYADDKEYANSLLEGAAEALRQACDGGRVIEDIPAAKLNFVAAVWYAEYCAIQDSDEDPKRRRARKVWLNSVRHALPSCFCDPSDLPPG